MRNFLFVIFVLVILAANGLVFWLWLGGRFSYQKDNFHLVGKTYEPTPSVLFERQGILPSAGDIYKKPAENKTIKFPIFNYHHIRPMPPESAGVTERAFTVTPEGFEAHLKYLKDNGYQIVSVYDLLAYFDMGQPLSLKAVALTFDDGRYGQYKWAFPLLKKYGMTATFFIITDWVGKPDFLTWTQIKEMSDGGMTISSHTLDHPHLSSLNDDQLRSELADSKKILEEKIGLAVDLLAYPGGDYNERVIGFAKEAGYRAAMGVYKVIEQLPKYRYAIRRFHADDDLGSITSKLIGY